MVHTIRSGSTSALAALTLPIGGILAWPIAKFMCFADPSMEEESINMCSDFTLPAIISIVTLVFSSCCVGAVAYGRYTRLNPDRVVLSEDTPLFTHKRERDRLPLNGSSLIV